MFVNKQIKEKRRKQKEIKAIWVFCKYNCFGLTLTDFDFL